MAEKHQCCATVFPRGVWVASGYACSRKGVIERDGKWYCRQHDPVSKAERDKASMEKWRREQGARSEAWERRTAEGAACKGVATGELVPGLVAGLLAEKNLSESTDSA